MKVLGQSVSEKLDHILYMETSSDIKEDVN